MVVGVDVEDVDFVDEILNSKYFSINIVIDINTFHKPFIMLIHNTKRLKL